MVGLKVTVPPQISVPQLNNGAAQEKTEAQALELVSENTGLFL